MGQSKPSEMKVLLQALLQLTLEVASLKQSQKATATKRKKRVHARSVEKKDIFRETVPLPVLGNE